MTENSQAQPAANPELPTQYAPAEVEGKLYERWVERGYFTVDPKSEAPYTIVIPPPNVTGSLHLGHAFQHTLMDALTRRKRMQGYEALWLPGMDHAGIATQNKVEQQLAEEEVAARPRPGRVRLPGLAVEGRVRRPDSRPDAAPGRRRRLDT